MQTIYKYDLKETVLMPEGAEILSLQMQGGSDPSLLAKVDTSRPQVARRFEWYETGHPISDNPGLYVGTVQTRIGLVFHVFDVMGVARKGEGRSEAMTHFDHLLNAFEQASQADNPAKEGYAEKRRALLAYVRELESYKQDAERYRWRPIETAPKDGSSVLLLVEDSDYPLEDERATATIGAYGTEGGTEFDQTWNFAGWDWCQDRYVRVNGTPTHWMPLPSV